MFYDILVSPDMSFWCIVGRNFVFFYIVFTQNEFDIPHFYCSLVSRQTTVTLWPVISNLVSQRNKT
jgi:hypothetical protein